MSAKAFVMIKPDGVERGLVGDILSRFEKKGLRLIKAELKRISKEKAGSDSPENASQGIERFFRK